MDHILSELSTMTHLFYVAPHGIRDTKGTFHAKMGSIKDRNGRDLTEAEDIRRGSKNTQKNYTKRS